MRGLQSIASQTWCLSGEFASALRLAVDPVFGGMFVRRPFHPKCQILATPEIIDGAPVLGIMFSDECKGEKFDGSEPGLYCGFGFLHRIDEPPSSWNFYDFDRLKCIDIHVEDVIENAIPGLYTRESELAPFTWEEFDFGEDDDAVEDGAGQDEEE